MKSKYESLSDGALFRILKFLMNECVKYWSISSEYELDGLPKSSHRGDVTDKILKTLGLDYNEIDVNYFWVCLIDNRENIFRSKKLDFEIERPELKTYRVVLEHHGSSYYTEYSAHNLQSYNEESAKDVKMNDGFKSWEGDYFDYSVNDSEESDWNVESIEEVNNSTNEQIVQKETFDLENLTLFQLIDLKESVEKRINNKKRLI